MSWVPSSSTTVLAAASKLLILPWTSSAHAAGASTDRNALANRTSDGPACFVLTSGHTFSGLAGKTEIYAVFGRHLGTGRKVHAPLVAARNDAIDLALLRAETDECPTARPGAVPALGASIWVVG